MDIKRIIKEEFEGFKDSNEEDWAWANDIKPLTNEFTKETFIRYLDDYDILFEWSDDGVIYSYHKNKETEVIEVCANDNNTNAFDVNSQTLNGVVEYFNSNIYRVIEFRKRK